MTTGAAGQEFALLFEEVRKLNEKVDSIERESKRKDETIQQLMEAVNKKDRKIDDLLKQMKEKDAEMVKMMDDYAKQISKLNEEEEEEKEEKGKNIFQSMLAYIKKHPRLIATAAAAGIIGGFLTLYGLPIIWGAAAVTWKTAVAGGCVAGGTTLLVGDAIVTEMEKKRQ